jgi:vacuolar-type H+-ATPase subunit I/STV1
MFNLIPQIILFLAVGAIVALIAKNISKVKKFSNQTEEIPAALKIPRENKFFKKIPLEKLNDEFNRLLEKFIRKVRIIMMRTDTRLQRRLESLKDSNKPKTLFKVEEKNEENISEVITETEVLITGEGLEEDLSVIKGDKYEVINENANLEKIDELVIVSNSESEADIKPVKKRRKKKEVIR